MDFLIIKASDWEYKEIKKIKSLKELLDFQKVCDYSIIISPFDEDSYEEYDISENHEIAGIIEIYDDWIEK